MQLDSWTDAFEAADAARQEAVGKAAAEDGWTLVTRTRVSCCREPPIGCYMFRMPADFLKAYRSRLVTCQPLLAIGIGWTPLECCSPGRGLQDTYQ